MGVADVTRTLKGKLLNAKTWAGKGRSLLWSLKARWMRHNCKAHDSSFKICIVDQTVILEAYKQAVIARNKGQCRLALLLAHQCECAAGDPPPPEIAALIADLRRSMVAN